MKWGGKLGMAEWQWIFSVGSASALYFSGVHGANDTNMISSIAYSCQY